MINKIQCYLLKLKNKNCQNNSKKAAPLFLYFGGHLHLYPCVYLYFYATIVVSPPKCLWSLCHCSVGCSSNNILFLNYIQNLLITQALHNQVILSIMTKTSLISNLRYCIFRKTSTNTIFNQFPDLHHVENIKIIPNIS